jgi:UDP-N-acetylmuramoyl-L-alanyl-D-glutamate--2,6-diaminopimelate ligase
MKPLTDYLTALKSLITDVRLSSESLVNGVTNDSRMVQKGSLFVAIKGAAADGHRYINAAIDKGASAVIYSDVQPNLAQGADYIRVKDTYYAYAMAMECFLDFPARELTLCGITGTKGKTTTAFVLEKILSDSGRRCGLITTVKYADGRKVKEAARTTPEAGELQTLFRNMADNGCSDVVMEVSSHGLHQHRTGSAQFKTAIFTNLSGDHLDYHLNMENYYQAKKLLFTEFLAENGVMIVNTDDPYGERLLKECGSRRQAFSFGKNSACSCRITDVQLSALETSFSLQLGGKSFRIKTNLIGEHNIYNLTGAFLAAYASGLEPEKIVPLICRRIDVPGRLQQFVSPSGVSYFVDYAHTDDALVKVLTILKTIATGRIITVFGCGGDRDRTKRPRMGAAAAQYSDLVIVTSDNPRSEDPLRIIEEIRAGIPAGTRFIEQPDRKQAILLAAANAVSGDIVLVAGKGHENYQEQHGVHTHFDDREIVADICKSIH